MRIMKRRLVTVPAAALASCLSLGPSPLMAQNVAARAVVPVVQLPGSFGAASISASSPRLDINPGLSAQAPLVPTLISPSLIPSAVAAARPQAAAVPTGPIAVVANAKALGAFAQSAAADDATGKAQALDQIFENLSAAKPEFPSPVVYSGLSIAPKSDYPAPTVYSRSFLKRESLFERGALIRYVNDVPELENASRLVVNSDDPSNDARREAMLREARAIVKGRTSMSFERFADLARTADSVGEKLRVRLDEAYFPSVVLGAARNGGRRVLGRLEQMADWSRQAAETDGSNAHHMLPGAKFETSGMTYYMRTRRDLKSASATNVEATEKLALSLLMLFDRAGRSQVIAGWGKPAVMSPDLKRAIETALSLDDAQKELKDFYVRLFDRTVDEYERLAAALPRSQGARRTKRSLDRGEAVTVSAAFQIAGIPPRAHAVSGQILNRLGFSKDIPLEHRALLGAGIRKQGEEMSAFLAQQGFKPEELHTLRFQVASSQKDARVGSGASQALRYDVDVYSEELSRGHPVQSFIAVVDPMTKAMALKGVGSRSSRRQPRGKQIRR